MKGIHSLYAFFAFQCAYSTANYVDLKADNKSIYTYANRPLNVTCKVALDPGYTVLSVQLLKTGHLGSLEAIFVHHNSCYPGDVLIVYCDHVNLEFTFGFNSSQYAIGDNLRCGATFVPVNENSPQSAVLQNDSCTITSIVEIVTTEIIDNGTVNIGKSKMFSCISSPPCRPKASLKWVWASGEIISSGIQPPVYIDNSTLLSTTMQNLNYTAKMEDIGRGLFCEGQQLSVRVYSAILNLDIRYPPTSTPVLYRNISGPILTNDNVNFTCAITGGNPLATFSWFCNTIKINSTSTAVNDTSISTLILKIDPTYHGKRCKCVAFHPVGGMEKENSTSISVIYAPNADPVITQDTDGPIIEGNVVSLKCSVTGGNPVATLNWNCSGVFIKETSTNESILTLKFNVTAMDNDKVCTCVARHPNISTYERRTSHKLDVYYSPTLSPVIIQKPNGTVDNGTKIVLECTAFGGNPLPVLEWDCKSDTSNATSGNVANYSTEIIVTPTDNGRICSCSASHPVTTYRQIINHTLEIYYAPQNAVMLMEPQPWLAGTMYNLSCSYSKGNPTASIKWILNGRMLPNSSSHTISFTATKKFNGKSLNCEVSNDYTTRHDITVLANETRLNIEYEPEVNITVESIVRTEGENITTLCVANGNPNPNVTWIFNDTTQTESNRNISELRLLDIKRFQHGTYVCQATSASAKYGNLQSNKSLLITIQFAPDIRVMTNGSFVTEESTITLSCEADGNPPYYTYQGWRHTYNGAVIRDSHVLNEYTEGKKLILRSLKYDDTGEYFCYARNGIINKNGLTQNGSTEINIKVAPLLLSHLPIQNTFPVKKNGRLSIEMDFVAVPNVTSMEWYNISANSTLRENSEIRTNFEITPVNTTLYHKNVTVTKNSYRATLDVNNFQDYMEGWYSLLVTNIIKTANVSVKAVVSDVPDPPKNIKVNGSTETTIQLMWTRGDDGGHLQTFHFVYHEKQNFAEINEKTIDDTYNEQQVLRITELKPKTFYNFTIFASNAIGKSSVLSYNASTSAKTGSSTDSSPGALIGGIIGSLAGIAVIVFVIALILLRNRRITKSDREKDHLTKRTRNDRATTDDEGEGLKDNILYVSADDIGTTETSNGYAEVKNPKRETNAVYTDVRKGTNTPSEGKGDVYENFEMSVRHNHSEEMVINKNRKEKPTAEQSKKNKDGLIYADLDLASYPSGKKFVIHGIENRSNYAIIDLTKKADPLPSDDDDELQEENTTHNNDNEVKKQKII